MGPPGDEGIKSGIMRDICKCVLVYSWLRHYATSQKVAGSSPDEVEFFYPSSRTMALGSTQPLTEMSTRNLPGG
jgi:hypothetical protein